jgi:hypothetical protein
MWDFVNGWGTVSFSRATMLCGGTWLLTDEQAGRVIYLVGWLVIIHCIMKIILKTQMFVSRFCHM